MATLPYDSPSPQKDIDVAIDASSTETAEPMRFKATLQIWIIIGACAFTSLLSAFEATAVSTALPTISEQLDLGYNYVWVANSFFLTSAACQPFFAQSADIFGRRWPTIISVAIFTLGSGISGGATNTAMLLSGRALQGIGGGGINLLVDLIACDIIPLRDRGRWMGFLFSTFAIGTGLGPFVGGAIVSNTTWRWVFYLQLPIGGISLVLLYFYLHMNHVQSSTIQKLKSIDYTGNIILVGSITSMLIALSWGGARYAWNDARVIVPLVIGFAGLAVFVLYEASPLCKSPTTPMMLFTTRTSCAAFGQTFLHAMLHYWWVYMLPVYFQGVLLSTPERSGVQLLPTVITMVPAAILGGSLMSKVKEFKLVHMFAAAMVLIALGCFSTLNSTSSTAAWALLQMVFSLGSGMLLTTLLAACQASMPESATAAATGAWAFFRSLGGIWGFAIPAAVFNSRFDQLVKTVSDSALREALSGGDAFSRASRGFVLSLPVQLRGEVIRFYTDSLRIVWLVSVAFGALLFLGACIEKSVALRTELETEYGVKETTAKVKDNDTPV